MLINAAGTSASVEIVYHSPGASTISLGTPDQPAQVPSVTIEDHSPVTLPLTDLDGSAGPFTADTNNPAVVTPTVAADGTLTLTGLQPGRASVKITDTATGETRYLGVRVKNPDGTLPGLPPYLAVGSGSTTVDSDVTFYEQFGAGSASGGHHADLRDLYLLGGPTNVNPHNWFGATQPGGNAVTSYLRDSLRLGMIPFFIYENINGTGGGYSNDTAHAQDATFMLGYFTDLQAALDLVRAQAPDDTVGFLLEPEFLAVLSQAGADPTTFAVRTDAAYAAGVLVHGKDPEFSNTVTGYVQAVNYLINRTLPSACFGWDIDVAASPARGYTVALPARGIIHLTDGLDLATGRAGIAAEARAIAHFYLAAGVTGNHASFVATTKPGASAGREGASADPADSADFWNEVLWGNFVAFTDALADETGLPVVLYAMPYGHLNHSLLANPAGGLFPDLDDAAQQYEDSASDFFFGDAFAPGAGNRLTYFGVSDPLLSVAVSGPTLTWPTGAGLFAGGSVRLVMFGVRSADDTDGASNPPTDGGWWITAVQNYYAHGAIAEAATANPVAPVPMPRPALLVSVKRPAVVIGEGIRGKFVLRLSEPAATQTVIQYRIVGQAINGVDYTLSTSQVVFQPGQDKVKLKVAPMGDLEGFHAKNVKLQLLDGSGYVIGTSGPVKVKIERP